MLFVMWARQPFKQLSSMCQSLHLLCSFMKIEPIHFCLEDHDSTSDALIHHVLSLLQMEMSSSAPYYLITRYFLATLATVLLIYVTGAQKAQTEK